MNIINSFLEKLHTDESMFPMDNYATDESEDDEKKTLIPEQKNSSDKKRIMIDLDGTIHKFSKGWNGGDIYDPPFEGSIDAIKWLKKQGFEIMIFTARASKANNEEMGGDYLDQLKKIKKWLDEYNVPYDGITADKLTAEFYIDDKAVYIPNGNWDFVIQTIQKRMSA
jgi:capsule biosynthesis phosphatase